MTINKALFTSDSTEWETPQYLFDGLNREFNFTLDVCATHKNSKCKRFFSEETNGLLQDWTGEICWMNPPYSRTVGRWLLKAQDAAAAGATVVCLLPARTSNKWFFEYIWDGLTHKPRTGVEVRFLEGRVRFVGAESGAPFPSMIVIFKGRLSDA